MSSLNQNVNDPTLARRHSILYTVMHFHRPKTFLEKQPYIVTYGTALATVGPSLTGYQLMKLYKIQKPSRELVGLALRIFPHQAVLLSCQLNTSSAIKEVLNPWAAFFVVGVLQGGIYGFSNIHFSKHWNLGTAAASAPNMYARIRVLFRGSGFGGIRDTISQGVPFMFSGAVQANLLDKIIPTPPKDESDDDFEPSPLELAKHWTALIGTSICATYISHGFNLCQTTLQTNTNMSYAGAAKKVWTDHGFAAFYRGAEARVGLLLIINILNELLLKPAWEPVRETKRVRTDSLNKDSTDLKL